MDTSRVRGINRRSLLPEEGLAVKRGSPRGRRQPRAGGHLILILAMILAMILGLGPAHAGVQRGVVVVSGELNAELEPCGCPGSPSGGMARRATAMAHIRAEQLPLLVVDTGNALLPGATTRAPVTDHIRTTAKSVIALLAATGTQLMAVGPRDLWALGVDGLKEAASGTGLTLLSSNVRRPDGSLAFAPSSVVLLGGLKVGVIGVTEPQQVVASREQIQFLDPLEAVIQQAGRLRLEVDFLLLLANLSPEAMERLRTARLEVDLLIAGGRPTELEPVSKPPYLVFTGSLGRTLTRLDLWGSPGVSLPMEHAKEQEQRMRQLTGRQDELEALKRLIEEEEGKPNPARLQKEGALLMKKIDSLSHDPLVSGPDVRAFAWREVGLSDSLPEDPRIKRAVEQALKDTP